ncbi:MAG: ADP-ribosylglycohydrolase family protein [Bacteroidetes bacterium]|nr:ADP-ribosylglycohydrolase family protein [Bacteroidota bacterium]
MYVKVCFVTSLVSLFKGEGNLKQTIKIGALTGWNSCNPTATWGGLLGFMLGKDGIEKVFGRTFSINIIFTEHAKIFLIME